MIMPRGWLIIALLVLSLPVASAQRIEMTLPDVGKTILTLKHVPGESGHANSVQIECMGKRSTITPRNQIARIPDTKEERTATGLWANISGLRLDASRFFERGEYSSDSGIHTLLFFISEGYASDAAPLLVVGFRPDGSPYKVLERDEMDMTSFQALPHGTASIIGKPTLSQSMSCVTNISPNAPSATTYDPYSVFLLHPDAKAVYSPSASQTYNRQHYVWAGPHSREDYAVIYNLPGHKKLFGTPASRLSTLMPPCSK